MGLVDEHERATAQKVTAQNAAYDAFVDKLDFSSGRYETHVSREGKLVHVWRAKLFVLDVVEKHGPGKYRVQVRDDMQRRLSSFDVEG